MCHHLLTPHTNHTQSFMPLLTYSDNDQGRRLNSILVNTPARLVGDGSYDKPTDIGSAAAILESYEMSSQALNAAIVPSNAPSPETRQNDPYRCELYAILLGLQMIYDLEKRFTSTYRSIIVSVDNDSALQQSIVYDDPIDTTYQHYDMLISIRSIRHEIRTPITFQYVEGHRDDTVPYTQLTRTEQLNVECDTIAKTIRSNSATIHDLTPPLHLPHERISLWHNHSKIYSKYNHHLARIGCTTSAQNYYCNKYKWTTAQFHQVNWHAIDKAMHMCTPSTRTWISKFACGFIGTAQMLSRREYWLESKCPRCLSAIENNEHVIKCPSECCRTDLLKSLSDLYDWMKTTNTAPILQSEIMRLTNHWIDYDIDTTILSPCPAITSQIRLGWSHFIFGRIHCDITTLQDNHYLSIGSKRDSRSWTAQLIQRLWTKIIRPCWNQRNVKVHGNKTEPSQSRLLADMRAEVQEIYTTTNHDDLLYQDRHLFDRSLDTLLTSSLPQLTAWRNNIDID